MPSSSAVFQVPVYSVCLKCALMKWHSISEHKSAAHFHAWVLQDDVANLWCVLMHKPVTIARLLMDRCVDVSLHQQFMLVSSTLKGTQSQTFLMLPKKISFFLSDPFWPLTVGVEGYCCTWCTQTCTRTCMHTNTQTHTHTHSVGPLWTRDWPIIETFATFTSDRHPCHWWGRS